MQDYIKEVEANSVPSIYCDIESNIGINFEERVRSKKKRIQCGSLSSRAPFAHKISFVPENIHLNEIVVTASNDRILVYGYTYSF